MVKRGGKISVKGLDQFIRSTYENTPNEIAGYKLDKKLSTKYTKVYWDDVNKRGIFAERPTSDLRDVASDVLLGLDLTGKIATKIDSRFKNSWATYDKIDKKYGLDKFIGIGYSLGSTVLERYPKVEQLRESLYVSKPVAPSDIITGKKPVKGATEIRSTLDAVSALKPLQAKAEREKIIKATTWNPFKEHQVAHILPQLNQDEQLGDPNVETGAGQPNFNKMKVTELKQYIKSNRKRVGGCQVCKKNKKELVQIAHKILNELNGGKSPDEIIRQHEKAIKKQNKQNKKIEEELKQLTKKPRGRPKENKSTKVYCGYKDKLPTGYKRFGNMTDCAINNQLSRFGRYKIDSRTAERAKNQISAEMSAKSKEKMRNKLMPEFVKLRTEVMILKKKHMSEKDPKVKESLKREVIAKIKERNALSAKIKQLEK